MSNETCPTCLHPPHEGHCSVQPFCTCVGWRLPYPPSPPPPARPERMSEKELAKTAADLLMLGTVWLRNHAEGTESAVTAPTVTKILAECRRARLSEDAKDVTVECSVCEKEHDRDDIPWVCADCYAALGCGSP